MGFRFPDGRKPRVAWASDAEIFHYGWARSEKTFRVKQRSFTRLYVADDGELENRLTDPGDPVYKNSRYIVPFTGTHPAPMLSRVDGLGGPDRLEGPFTDSSGRRLLEIIERRLGVRFGEPRNFRLLGGKRGPPGYPARPLPFDSPPTV